MGEYIRDYKIGTCEELLYITREELEGLRTEQDISREVERYLSLKPGFIYRFPRKNAPFLGLETCSKREPFDYITIEADNSLEIPHKDFSQMEMRSTTTGAKDFFNLSFCPMDKKHFREMFPVYAAGWGRPPEEVARTPIQIIGNRYTEEYPNGYTVFQCAWCRSTFSLDEKEIDEHVKPVLLERGMEYEAEYLKARA